MKSDPHKPALRAWSDEIDVLLGEQLTRIRRRFLVHGLGWMLAAFAGSLLLYFLLDVALQLPAVVRVLLTIGFVAYLTTGLRRRVLYPMRRAFGHDDVAIAIERVFPELSEKLITAHELKDALSPDTPREGLRNQSAAMVERVVADAATTVRGLPTERILTARPTGKVYGMAATLTVALLFSALIGPERFGVFLRRALGISVEYPRLTHLYIELPEGEAGLRIARRNGRADVLMAAGADLPVLVRVEGVVPREVSLAILGGRGLPGEIAMSQRPGERFRHVFRRAHGEFSFHARGGDDPRGDLEVFVHTIEPPRVGTIEAELTYPAYTHIEPEHRFGGAIEGLVGTEVTLTVTATAPVQRAALHFLDAGTRIELHPVHIEDDSGVGRTFAGHFVVQATDRYEVELHNAEGLGNPRPGTYPVIALEDHAPVGRILLPGGDDVTVVLPNAHLPIRVHARDDFGLARVTANTATGRSETISQHELLPAEADGPGDRETVLTALLAVADLEAGGGPRQGDTIGVSVELVDNREPDAGRTELARRQVHVVDPVELARRISSHFRRIRDQVDKALEQHRGQSDALETLLEDVPDPTAGRDPRLITLQVGQARIVSAANRVREDLMRAYDVHLFNGLEGADSIHAPSVEQLYLQFLGESQVAEAQLPGFYRSVGAEQAAGRIGPMNKFLDPILDMTLRADRIVEDSGRRAVDILDEAGVSPSVEDLRESLVAVQQIQTDLGQDLEALLSQLQEWNEFQDVVQQVRALRDAQKDVEYRTRTLR